MAKRFKFKLESLKKMRENRVLAAKKDMALVVSKVQELEENIKKVDQDSRDSIGFSHDVSNNGALALLMGTSMIHAQVQKRASLKEELARAEKELEKHKDWVAHLSKESKAVEKLEEKEKERYDAKIKLREKKSGEAWVVEQWANKKLAGGSL